MPDSILLFRRQTLELSAEPFLRLAERLELKGELVRTDEALFVRGDHSALAYGQPCARFAGLLFYADQSAAWGGVSERLVEPERARAWTHEALEAAALLPKGSDDDRVRLKLELDAFETEAVVFDGKERRRVKAKTDVVSRIELNGIPVVGPRGKVRLVFKHAEPPVMLQAGLWERLAVYEERERVREHDAVRTVHDRLAVRGDCGTRAYDIRDVRLVYLADEYRGGPDLLAPEYLVEVEMRDPRPAGRQPAQGPRRVLRVPAYR
jgi:hypothetical protein